MRLRSRRLEEALDRGWDPHPDDFEPVRPDRPGENSIQNFIDTVYRMREEGEES